jgi:response regulator of citrate/malate metabolism
MHWVVLIFNVGGGTWSACLSNVEQFVCFGVAHTHADLIVTDPSHLFDPAGILIMLQAVNHNISCKLLVTSAASRESQHQLQAVHHNFSGM